MLLTVTLEPQDTLYACSLAKLPLPLTSSVRAEYFQMSERVLCVFSSEKSATRFSTLDYDLKTLSSFTKDIPAVT